MQYNEFPWQLAVVIASLICLASILVDEHSTKPYRRQLSFVLALLGGSMFLVTLFLFFLAVPDGRATMAAGAPETSNVEVPRQCSRDINVPCECTSDRIGACL